MMPLSKTPPSAPQEDSEEEQHQTEHLTRTFQVDLVAAIAILPSVPSPELLFIELLPSWDSTQELLAGVFAHLEALSPRCGLLGDKLALLQTTADIQDLTEFPAFCVVSSFLFACSPAVSHVLSNGPFLHHHTCCCLPPTLA